MTINVKDRKLIRKYYKLRGVGTPSLQFDILLDVYTHANKANRMFYKREMLAYLEAIEKGEIKPGQPITEANRVL